jgi:hypothetical protein
MEFDEPGYQEEYHKKWLVYLIVSVLIGDITLSQSFQKRRDTSGPDVESSICFQNILQNTAFGFVTACEHLPALNRLLKFCISFK